MNNKEERKEINEEEMSMNLCVDIDGTVTDPLYWLNRANDYFGMAICPEQVNEYAIHRVMNVPEIAYREFYNIYGALVHKEAAPLPGAREILTMLHSQQHAIHFVSAREERMRAVTEEWLKRYRMPYDSLALLGDPNKIWKARQLQCDLFIEDCLDNAIQLAGAGFHVVLIDCSYNQGRLPARVLRVHHWKEILDLAYRRTAGDRNPLSA
jgi:hypothetical protein